MYAAHCMQVRTYKPLGGGSVLATTCPMGASLGYPYSVDG